MIPGSSCYTCGECQVTGTRLEVAVVIERLQRALQHIDELPQQAQEDIAQQIEELTSAAPDWRSLIGSVILPDDYDEIDEILKARREVLPSQPLEDDL